MYAINHGLAPFLKSALMSDLQKSDIHTYSFDESLNEITQTQNGFAFALLGC